MNNMQIYEAGRQVPPEAQKAFDNGSFKGTDINPMWRIKKLTELFGPCGIGWYYEVVSERSETHHDQTMAIVDLNLFVKVDGEWSKPIYGTGGNLLVRPTKSGPRASDEGYKMALTDALSVACKALGIGADIYFSKDRTKYTDCATEAPKPAAPNPPAQDRPTNAKIAKEWSDAQGLTAEAFGNHMRAAIANKACPNKKLNDMTDEEFNNLLRWVSANV
jgi:hypothetical protein